MFDLSFHECQECVYYKNYICWLETKSVFPTDYGCFSFRPIEYDDEDEEEETDE